MYVVCLSHRVEPKCTLSLYTKAYIKSWSACIAPSQCQVLWKIDSVRAAIRAFEEAESRYLVRSGPCRFPHGYGGTRLEPHWLWINQGCASPILRDRSLGTCMRRLLPSSPFSTRGWKCVCFWGFAVRTRLLLLYFSSLISGQILQA